MRLNRSVSYKKKNGVYVFYIDFNFLFLKKTAAKIMDAILDTLNSDGTVNTANIPEEFISFLLSRKILTEET